MSGPSPADSADLEVVLAARFGLPSFRPPQEEVIRHLLAGGDALLVMPTGGGKSLCYQLPALLLDGLTVVLSPLIALMQDQVDQLRARGIAATFINSSLDRRERERRLGEVAAGRIKLLYVTPERFRQEQFRAVLARVRIALLAVDEAHCVSAWGHDFRPEYGRLGSIRELLGRPPTLALTATATPETRADVLARLGIGGARQFLLGLERPNLRLAVRHVGSEQERFAAVAGRLAATGGAAIVYMALIQDLLGLQERLLGAGLAAQVYHGELPRGERRRVAREFLSGASRVILATSAFGMGIDKADVRVVLHGQVPGSLEAYCQEVGRAGRDGAASLCELIYLPEDLLIQQRFVKWANPDGAFLRAVHDRLEQLGERLQATTLDDLKATLLVKNRADQRVETALGLLAAEGIVDGSLERGDLAVVRPLERGEEHRLIEPDKERRDLLRLQRMVDYAGADTCRKRILGDTFGLGATPSPCHACDRCLTQEELVAGLPPRAAPIGGAAPGTAAALPVTPGDWLLINERFTVCVRGVRQDHRGCWVVQGTSAADLKLRTYDLSKVDWRVLPAE